MKALHRRIRFAKLTQPTNQRCNWIINHLLILWKGMSGRFDTSLFQIYLQPYSGQTLQINDKKGRKQKWKLRISSFRLSHKTDIMSLMSSWKVCWPISVLPLDNCPTEAERELYNFCNKNTGQTSFSFHRHPFCGRTNMYKEGNKLYSISCYEIKFSSDLLPRWI